MTPANDNARATFKTLDNLPLFATDKEIAVAIVGTKRANEWLRDKFPTISVQPGFPPLDLFHGGRATRLVSSFYERYVGTANGRPGFAPDGADKEVTWKRAKRRA